MVTTVLHIEENQIHGVNAHSEFMGLSSDAKPDFAPENSLFLELDTNTVYYFHGESWEAMTTPALSSELADVDPITIPGGGDGDDDPINPEA